MLLPNEGLSSRSVYLVPIFYYHSVGGPPPQTLAREIFQEHLELIKKHDFCAITLHELLQGDYPKRAVVLTFDDGLLDNFEVVFPLLQSYNMRATFFVVPGYDEVTRWVNPETGGWSDIETPGFTIPFQSMKAEHRLQLVQNGMEIACHTFTHRKLTHIDPSEWKREIVESRHHLQSELGRAINTFCYPNGRFNLAILREVEQAGYKGACSTIPGYYKSWKYRYLLPRFLVEDPKYFEQVLIGRAFSPKNLFYLLLKFIHRRRQSGILSQIRKSKV